MADAQAGRGAAAAGAKARGAAIHRRAERRLLRHARLRLWQRCLLPLLRPRRGRLGIQRLAVRCMLLLLGKLCRGRLLVLLPRLLLLLSVVLGRRLWVLLPWLLLHLQRQPSCSTCTCASRGFAARLPQHHHLDALLVSLEPLNCRVRQQTARSSGDFASLLTPGMRLPDMVLTCGAGDAAPKLAADAPLVVRVCRLPPPAGCHPGSQNSSESIPAPAHPVPACSAMSRMQEWQTAPTHRPLLPELDVEVLEGAAAATGAGVPSGAGGRAAARATLHVLRCAAVRYAGQHGRAGLPLPLLLLLRPGGRPTGAKAAAHAAGAACHAGFFAGGVAVRQAGEQVRQLVCRQPHVQRWLLRGSGPVICGASQHLRSTMGSTLKQKPTVLDGDCLV